VVVSESTFSLSSAFCTPVLLTRLNIQTIRPSLTLSPFSAFVPRCHMKPIFKIRECRSIFRLDPHSCALLPKNFLVPAPESLATAIIFYFHHRLQAILLFSHQAHRSLAYLMPPSTLLKTHSHQTRPHRGAASFKSLYQRRPPQILMRLPISPLRSLLIQH
jgi:hypothetical protein